MTTRPACGTLGIPAAGTAAEASRPRARRACRGRRQIRRTVSAIAVLGVATVGWETAARRGGNLFFPPPSAIAAWIHDHWLTGPPSRLYLGDAFLADTSASLTRTLSAWAIAAVLGTILGLLLGQSRIAFDLANPVLQFARATPPVIVIPVLFFLFGIGAPLQMALIIIGTIWPVLLNTVAGARAVDPELLDSVRILRVSRRQRLLHVVVPAAAPAIFTGLRISLGLSLVLMVVSELYAATDGIGYALLDAQRSFDLTGMWAWIAVIALIGNLGNAALSAVERQALARHRPTDLDQQEA